VSLFEAVRVALDTIWTQKMKSAFALVGVFIGVTFLIAVVSVIQGMNRYMTDQFAGTLLGVNQFNLRRYPNVQTGSVGVDEFREWLRRPYVTHDDAEAVSAGITVPVTWAWESTSQMDVEYRDQIAEGVTVIAASASYFDIKPWVMQQGRAFTMTEARSSRPVLVLGSEVASVLFGEQDPVGKEVKVRGFPYRVVGVVERQGNVFGFSLDNFVVGPALSPLKRFTAPPGTIDNLIVKAHSGDEMTEAIGQAEAIMRSRRHLRPGEDMNFVLETSDSVLSFWERINTIMTAALPGLVSISLIVGAIVIMNIMLMAVAERTKEIGIRKSLGARRRDILRQFLVESASIALAGAAIGIGAGLALAWVVDATTPLPAEVAPWSIGIGVLLGAGVGVVAGVYPARRASRLDPVIAMRQE